MSMVGVQTLSGVVAFDDMGHWQCHEHVLIAKGRASEVNPALYLDDLERSIQELMDYRNAGGSGLVDAQPIGCGRMPTELVEASLRSGVHIVASTGFHLSRYYVPQHWLRRMDEDSLAEMFIGELSRGLLIEGCPEETVPTSRIDSRAGIIKTALESSGIRAEDEKRFKAAALASKATGAPVMCHVEPGADVLRLIRFFNAFGVPCSSLILCHLDRGGFDIGYHKQVADTGVFLEYDTIQRPQHHSNDTEIALIREMVDFGYCDRILLSLDVTRARMRNYGADFGLDYILRSFIPSMLNAGIQEPSIRRMTVENPRSALSWYL
jgi:predicted metal-dependent phosphotriesterase family hydrolase